MKRATYPILMGLATLAPSRTTVLPDRCTVGGDCPFLSALQTAPASPADIDTLVFEKGGDSARSWNFYETSFEVNKPVVVRDSSELTTGRVRLRFEGISLILKQSPSKVEGLSFTRAGIGRSSLALMGSGPDRVERNYFNLAPGDSATGGQPSMYGLLVGPLNRSSRILSNSFGTYGTIFSRGLALRVYGDSTEIAQNSFGTVELRGRAVDASMLVPFYATSISVGSTVAAGQGGESDTVYAPVGGFIHGNLLALCSENASGIGIAGSTGEGGTRGWRVQDNAIGMNFGGSPLPGCVAGTDDVMAGITIISQTAAHAAEGNRVEGNLVGLVPTGIWLQGAGVRHNRVSGNKIGGGDSTGDAPVTFTGIVASNGAALDTISNNTILNSDVGIRLGWGTGRGRADSVRVVENRIGYRAGTPPTSAGNDTGIVLGNASAGNQILRNGIAGNVGPGLVFGSSSLGINRVDSNTFGRAHGGGETALPNGGDAVQSLLGPGYAGLKSNLFATGHAWAVRTASGRWPLEVVQNTFLAGFDSGMVLSENVDSLRILGNAMACGSKPCIQLRSTQFGRIEGNRFSGDTSAIVAGTLATTSWRTTERTAIVANTLPAVGTPIDLLGRPGTDPLDVDDADKGPMGLINAPLLASVRMDGDSLRLTYSLDLPPLSPVAIVDVYAQLPDSLVLLPLGSFNARDTELAESAIKPDRSLPAGTKIRVLSRDGAANTGELSNPATLGTTGSLPVSSVRMRLVGNRLLLPSAHGQWATVVSMDASGRQRILWNHPLDRDLSLAVPATVGPAWIRVRIGQDISSLTLPPVVRP